ncbi:hypothetical protein PoB_001698300 [Plakobranchus ocellatus]|uniref:Uncharacterized protein n=1 Tax=Plakobranchus ocellatus TaxID=259542 RepID=A0AAV3Z784_9GAST|nr:hypothetical protein PoB_001698300 [Plakobranchus ocellatus]
MCQSCSAKLWTKDTSSVYCSNGQVKHPRLQRLRNALSELFAENNAESRDFRQNTRSYNSDAFSKQHFPKVQVPFKPSCGCFDYPKFGFYKWGDCDCNVPRPYTCEKNRTGNGQPEVALRLCGEVKALCIPKDICDVIGGNVGGARSPEDPDMSIMVGAATIRAQNLREMAIDLCGCLHRRGNKTASFEKTKGIAYQGFEDRKRNISVKQVILKKSLRGYGMWIAHLCNRQKRTRS